MTEIQDSSAGQGTVEIPESMRVHCPLAGFKLRQVSKCVECPHLVGGALADRFPGSTQMPFNQRFGVPCNALPTMREIKEIE